MIARVAEMLCPVMTSLTVVADRLDKYADLGLRTIADTIPAAGPIAGLLSALEDLKQPGWLLLAPCDAVLIRPEWIESLAAHACAPNQAVAFAEEYWQPFPGLYHRSLLPELLERTTCGPLSLWHLLETTSSAALPLPKDWPAVFQVNSLADWQAAVSMLDAQP